MRKLFYSCGHNQPSYGLERVSLFTIAAAFKGSRWIAIDTETTGLSPINDGLLMIQMYNGSTVAVIDARMADLEPLKELFNDHSITFIAHNMKFDYKFLKSEGLIIENAYCTMLADKVIHCGKNMNFGLKDLLHRYCDKEMDKDVRSSFINHSGIFTERQVVYGIDDVLDLINIVKKQKPQIDRHKLQSVIDLENKAVLAFADIEYNGMYLDKAAWSKIAGEVKIKVDRLFYEMDMMLLHKHPKYKQNQLDMFGIGRPVTINWDSPSQVLEMLQIKNKKLDSVGANALRQLNDPLIKMYVEYKEATKAYNAYGPDFYKYLHKDGKVHTNFNQILYTGRVSSSGPNVQQIPSDNIYRNSFKPKNPDYVMVGSDFGAQELCIIAYGSQDPVWLDILSKGDDLHSACAEQVFGDKWKSLSPDPEKRKDTPEGAKMRKQIKTVSFGLCYGMQAAGLARTLDIPKKEAKRLIDAYFKAFPRIKQFLDMAGQYGLDNGHIKTFKPFNRIRWFENFTFEMDFETKSQIERWSMNTPIQGTAADMTKLAMIKLRDFLKTSSLRANVVMVIHDEIQCECHKDDAEDFAVELSRVMEEAAAEIVGKDLIKADAEITKVWTK